MLNFVSHAHLFESQKENHYRFYTQFDASQYPQYHDFYEITLVTDGLLRMELCGRRFVLQRGSLVFIRPYDVHSKSGSDCAHINLAFPVETVDALFEYLCDARCREEMLNAPFLSPCFLTPEQTISLEDRIKRLNTTKSPNWKQTRTLLRAILLDIITSHIFPMFSEQPQPAGLPQWLAKALDAWRQPEHLSEGLSFFCAHSGYTKEYVCRCFKQYLGHTPTVYLNSQRLNYAVNLLLHSDYPVTQIAYEAGFKSASRFHHLFRQTYGTSPRQFRCREMPYT